MTHQHSLDFRYTIYIKTTVEQLWKALTEAEYTTQYWDIVLKSEWTPGAQVTWEMFGISVQDPEQVVTEVEKPNKLGFTWHTITEEFGKAIEADPQDIAVMAAEPRSVVHFELEQVNDNTAKLAIRHTGFAEGSAILSGVTEGWPAVLSSLKTLLETGAPLDV